MTSKKTNPVVIDGVEYTYEDFTDEQKILVQHCLDLDRKIASTQFQLQQLQVGKESFIKMLKKSLEETPKQATDVAVQ